MKRFALILILTVAAAGAAFAGEPGGEHHANLTAILGLTPDQATAWENAERSFHDSTRPLLEQQRALRSQLEQMLIAKSDACSIGAQEQQVWNVGEQIKTAFTAFQKQRNTLLTPEQKTKLDALRANEMHEMHGLEERRKIE